MAVTKTVLSVACPLHVICLLCFVSTVPDTIQTDGRTVWTTCFLSPIVRQQSACHGVSNPIRIGRQTRRDTVDRNVSLLAWTDSESKGNRSLHVLLQLCPIIVRSVTRELVSCKSSPNSLRFVSLQFVSLEFHSQYGSMFYRSHRTSSPVELFFFLCAHLLQLICVFLV